MAGPNTICDDAGSRPVQNTADPGFQPISKTKGVFSPTPLLKGEGAAHLLMGGG